MNQSTRESQSSLYHTLVSAYRNRLIAEALQRNGGSVGLAARDLGIHRNMVTRAKRSIGAEVQFRRRAKPQKKAQVDLLVAASEKLYRLARLKEMVA
jgi:DNA-binding NtrC family response regulator